MDDKDLNQQKALAYYSESVHAWFQTSLELDKSIITLSSALIGLLLTLSFNRTLPSAAALILFGTALLSFFCSLALTLYALHGNRQHIVDVLSGKDTSSSGRLLKISDRSGQMAFAIGAILTTLLAISMTFETYLNKEPSMSDKNTNSLNEQSGLQPCVESFHGMQNLKPTEIQKSFTGMAALQPNGQAQPATPTTQTPQEGGSSTNK